MVHVFQNIAEISVFADRKFILLGDDWLYMLYYIYLADVLGKGDFICNDGTDNIVIAGQERKCKEVAEQLDDDRKEIYYCTNQVKNEIDAIVMKQVPDKYEREVLIARKRELDEEKENEFRKAIDEKMKGGKNTLFESIEIETVNRCNGRCDFCPVNINDDIREYQEMEEGLFYSIIDQLADMCYEGRVALFSNNDPLLDKRIVKFSEYTFNRLPNAYKTIFTNGTLIDESIFNSLICLLNLICFDVYYDDDPVKEMPEKLKLVIERLIADEDMHRKVMIQYICRRAIRNNRGGISSNRHAVYEVKAPCMLPFFQMIVRPDGKTSLCCNDPYGRMTLSDLCKESIVDAWNNENYRDARERMRHGRQNISICRGCDNFATLNTDARNIFSETDISDSWERTRTLFGK